MPRAYSEGDWFAVPLQTDGFALGLLARANPAGVLFGYFFGPKRVLQPALNDATGLRPEHAVLVGKFGHLGIRRGTWPLLGQHGEWRRGDWPIPGLIRYEELTGRSFRVRYDDTDPNRVLGEERVEPGAAEQGPKDGLMGAGFVEARLTALLS